MLGFNNGIILQFGTNIFSGVGDIIATITFPISFKTVYSVVPSIRAINRTNNYNSAPYINNVTLTNFKTFSTAGTTYGTFWIAVGN